MIIELPDPHPGRCNNWRIVHKRNGSTETLRCLDYEGVPHSCTFPDPMPDIDSTTWGGGSLAYTTPKPKPWVKP